MYVLPDSSVPMTCAIILSLPKAASRVPWLPSQSPLYLITHLPNTRAPSHKCSHSRPDPHLSSNSSTPCSLNLWGYPPSDQLINLNQHSSTIKISIPKGKITPKITNAKTNLVYYNKIFKMITQTNLQNSSTYRLYVNIKSNCNKY